MERKALLFHLSALLFHSVMRLKTKVPLSFMSRRTLEYIYFLILSCTLLSLLSDINLKVSLDLL